MARLRKDEMPVIMPWKYANGYNEKPISVKNHTMVCEWCRQMHRYHHPMDTGDVLYRWNIAMYQMCGVNQLIYSDDNDMREWGEAIGSVFIHAVACFENCGVCCDDYVILEAHTHHHTLSLYRKIVENFPFITRQVLYYAMGRKNRFDGKVLTEHGLNMLNIIIYMNNAYNPHLSFHEGLALAMDKLQNIEIKTH